MVMVLVAAMRGWHGRFDWCPISMLAISPILDLYKGENYIFWGKLIYCGKNVDALIKFEHMARLASCVYLSG